MTFIVCMYGRTAPRTPVQIVADHLLAACEAARSRYPFSHISRCQLVTESPT